jgi:hypothetical protein
MLRVIINQEETDFQLMANKMEKGEMHIEFWLENLKGRQPLSKLK